MLGTVCFHSVHCLTATHEAMCLFSQRAVNCRTDTTLGVATTGSKVNQVAGRVRAGLISVATFTLLTASIFGMRFSGIWIIYVAYTLIFDTDNAGPLLSQFGLTTGAALAGASSTGWGLPARGPGAKSGFAIQAAYC
jgi:hypothetical protein